jgi:polyhydroxyalkanoate synthesis regulator phasin
MSAGQTPHRVSNLEELAEAVHEQSEAHERAVQHLEDSVAKGNLTLEQLVKISQDLLFTTQKSLEKLSYIERRADTAGGDPADNAWLL